MKRNRPATAYQYRQCIALVQVLATAKETQTILDLCEVWGVAPVWTPYPLFPQQSYLNIMATVRRLAEHALAHAREIESEQS